MSEYQQWAVLVTESVVQSAKFLHEQKIFDARDLPYRTQVVPLTAIFPTLGTRAQHDGVQRKIARWFWCGVFGELYGSAVETRFARDLPEVIVWLTGGPEPTTMRDANFAPSRLRTLRSRNSAAYKGGSALLLRGGAIEPAHLRQDAFEAFFAARERALLDRIAGVMGKPMAYHTDTSEPEADEDEEGAEAA
ncbi:hypothetical protein HC928_09920 [bacterium]|nr:hypothetical protein [bacterium]